MTDSSAAPSACPVCGQVPAGPPVEGEGVCAGCGRPVEGVDPLRLAEDALRREAGDGGWLVD